MRVFISWSGERSRSIAEALRTWLPRVIQSVKPWMSNEDIAAGSRWLAEVSSELDSAQIGLLCVTPENQHSPWLVFEAGALSKSLDQSKVCPLLFDMGPGQLSGPITQFQSYVIGKNGMLRVLTSLNEGLDASKLSPQDLSAILDVWWPHLEEQLNTIGPLPTPAASRSTQEQLDELLSLSREQLRRENLRLEAGRKRDERFDRMLKMMDDSFVSLNSFQNAAQKLHAGAREALANALKSASDKSGFGPDKLGQVLEASSPGADSIVKVDLSSLKNMRILLQDFDEEQRSHINSLLSPPEGNEDLDPKAE